MSNHRLFYRPEIDGLRTIAVLSVILYHAEFVVPGGKFLTGGFLGVDVFFVISGYLITSLIIKEINETGRFSISQFYERRARRLLPALLLVMLVSSFYAYKYLYASQLIDFANSIAASISFVANIYWHVTLQEYGAESGAFKPFLHTWSLAVEEQFYLLFPLIFVFFYKRSVSKTALGMGFLLVLSLLAAQWTTRHYPSFSFFQLPTRLWELLAGALLALRVYSQQESTAVFWKTDSILVNLLATSSILILLASMVLISLQDRHPGFVTAIPVFATVCYIACARPEQWVTRVLSSKPFVGIGVISYSLYLWHYPIFAFARIRGKIFYTFEDKIILITATFIVSMLAYYLVEKTFRSTTKVTRRPFLVVTVASSVLLAALLAWFVQSDKTDRRFSHLVKLYGNAQFDNYKLKQESVTLVNTRPKAARFKEGSDKTKVLIIGNSHGKDLYNVFVQNMDLFSQYEFEYIGMGIGANDQRFQAKTLGIPWFGQSDVVVLSNKYMPRTGNYEGDLAVLGTFIDKVLSLDKKLIVMSNTVEFEDINDQRVFDWYVKNNEKFERKALKELFYKHRVRDVDLRINKQVKRIALEKGVPYLEKSEYMCDHQAKICDGVTDEGHKVFYDYGHYTLHGAKHFGKKIAEMGWFKLD